MFASRSIFVLLCFFLATIQAVVPINTSLATLPVGYFGGSKDSIRGPANLDMLSRMRVITIEKWEGPCWNECLANSSHNPPIPCESSCGEENYQLATLQAVKQRNPAVAGVFYLNTLYDFPYYKLTGQFTAADEHVRDVNGKVIGIENDNGMRHVPIFDFSQPSAVQRYLDFHRSIAARGLSDGTFPDKSDVFAFLNKSTNQWNLCENPGGPPRKHAWADACGQISEAKARAYNSGKQTMMSGLKQIYGPKGAVYYQNIPRRSPHLDTDDPIELHSEIVRSLQSHPYLYFMIGDNNDNRTNITRKCTDDIVNAFVLVVEEGAILGCNGWDERFGYPLGDPLGPPKLKTVSGNVTRVVERRFKSGSVIVISVCTVVSRWRL